MKKNSKNGIIVLALLIVALLLSHSLLTIYYQPPGMPTFPTAIAPITVLAQVGCPTQGVYALNHYSIGNGFDIYNITYFEPANSTCVVTDSPIPNVYGTTALVSFNVYLPQNYSNLTQVNYAIKQNNAQLNQTCKEIVAPDMVCSGSSYSTCHYANVTYYQLIYNFSILSNLENVYYSTSPQQGNIGLIADTVVQYWNEIHDAKILVLANQYITSHIIKPTTTTNTTTTASNTLTSNSTKTMTPSTQAPTIAQPPSATNVFSNFFNSIINAIMNFLKTYFGI